MKCSKLLRVSQWLHLLYLFFIAWVIPITKAIISAVSIEVLFIIQFETNARVIYFAQYEEAIFQLNLVYDSFGNDINCHLKPHKTFCKAG